MTLSARDIREFTAYLRDCTDAQVEGVYEKEREAGRDDYVALALNEANHRGICLDDPLAFNGLVVE